MKSIDAIRALALILVLLSIPHPSQGASNRFFNFSSGRRTAGLFTSFSDDVNYYFAQVRLKPAHTFEVGLKGGISDVNRGGSNSTGAYVGVDGNFKIATLDSPTLFDLYVTLGLSSIVKSRRAQNEFFIGPVGEKTLTSSSSLTIKGTLGLEGAVSGGSLFNDDEFDLFITAGLILNVGERVNIFLEGKGGTDFSGGLGVNFLF